MRVQRLIFILLFCVATSLYAVPTGKFLQFDFLGGQGTAKEGNSAKLPKSTVLMKLGALSSTGSWIRANGNFSLLLGSGTRAWEFALGTAIYPLGTIYRLPTQPFIGASGLMMSLTNSDETKLNFGFMISSGIDLRTSGTFGLKVAADYVSAGAQYIRLLVGFTLFFRR